MLNIEQYMCFVWLFSEFWFLQRVKCQTGSIACATALNKLITFAKMFFYESVGFYLHQECREI